MRKATIRVLVVEDSLPMREFLVHAFNAAPDMQVVATARDGDEALHAVQDARPGVVTMDIHMPRVDGLEATRRIMRVAPVPIVIVSGAEADEVSASCRALEAGALAFARKPGAAGTPADARSVSELVRTVRLMSEVKVVRRLGGSGLRPGPVPAALMPATLARRGSVDVVAIGASTGGPPATLALLDALPKSGAAPVLIVQHIAEGFLDGYCTWLSGSTGRSLHLAAHGEPLRRGHVYVAPDGVHMGVDRRAGIVLSKGAPEYGSRPAVSHLFRTVREAYGERAAGVLLSGMGKDGARELLDMRRAGALTFAEHSESAVVFGMPGEAARLGAADHVMAPGDIGAALAVALEGGLRRE